MAQRVVTTYVDDLDGTEINDNDGGTVLFSFDGQDYAIDLTSTNAARLRKALEPYVAVAKSGSSRTKRTAPRTSTVGPSARELRDWGRRNGFEIPNRGRIPNEVREAWTSQR